MSKKLTEEEFERMLDSQTETSRITLSAKKFSDHEIDEDDTGFSALSAPNINKKSQFDDLDDLLDDNPKKTKSETQSLADFLRYTGPEDVLLVKESKEKKKKGLFNFGKKKKDSSKYNKAVNAHGSMIVPHQQQKAKYVPLTSSTNVYSAVANSNALTVLTNSPLANSPLVQHPKKLSPDSNLTREQQQMLAREQAERDILLQQQMLSREQQNGFSASPNPTVLHSAATYSSPTNTFAPTFQTNAPYAASPVHFDQLEPTTFSPHVSNVYDPTEEYYSNMDNQYDDDDLSHSNSFDQVVIANTEYNAMLDTTMFNDVQKSKRKNMKSVIFNEMVEEIGHPDDYMDEWTENSATKPTVVGLGARGSYYPTFAPQPNFAQRHSSLPNQPPNRVVESAPPPSDPLPALPFEGKPKVKLVKTKKKIRHVQIQTRAAITKENHCQTLPMQPSDTPEDTKEKKQLEESNYQLNKQVEDMSETLQLLMKEKDELVKEMTDKSERFDKLSAQAYKKIKELLNEKKMLEIEVFSLKDQLDAMHDLQNNQWEEELDEQ